MPGTVKWVGETDELDPSTVPVEKDKAYTWKFTPRLDNYESITGSIILWTESGSGVVIIVPSQSGESTPASNPNTGAAHVGQLATGVAVVLAGMPMGGTTTILAEKYGADSTFASKCTAISTVLSLITTPLWCLVV